MDDACSAYGKVVTIFMRGSYDLVSSRDTRLSVLATPPPVHIGTWSNSRAATQTLPQEKEEALAALRHVLNISDQEHARIRSEASARVKSDVAAQPAALQLQKKRKVEAAQAKAPAKPRPAPKKAKLIDINYGIDPLVGKKVMRHWPRDGGESTAHIFF
jgi:hypothetical protein